MDFKPCSSLCLALYQSDTFLDVVVKDTGIAFYYFHVLCEDDDVNANACCSGSTDLAKAGLVTYQLS